MINILAETNRYLKDVLGLHVKPEKVSGKGLPVYLARAYDYYQALILDTTCMLIIPRGDYPPGKIAQHIDRLRERIEFPIVLVASAMTGYNRQRLLKHKVPFIVPSRQMYLPFFGVDLREHFQKLTAPRVEMKPAAQVLLLYLIQNTKKNGGEQPRYNCTELSSLLGYSIMTMSRSFDELAETAPVTITTEGRKRFLQLRHSPEKTWEVALPGLISPIHKRVRVVDLPAGGTWFKAGDTALAEYSMLGAPSTPEWACHRSEYDRLVEHEIPFDEPEEGSMILELWNYPPGILAIGDCVDPLSLYLCMRDEEDERVQMCLEEMIEAHKW